jgi:phospholipid/cholesterol/gamma-HCH transport system ATP-binding protein
MPETTARIEIRDLDMAFGSFVVQRNLNITIRASEIFVIMGDSGCGKSTLLRHMIGLIRPARGDVYYDGVGFWSVDEDRRRAVSRRFGILFQSGALWSSMTIAENVALPLQQYTDLSAKEIAEIVDLKLALVALRGFESYYPSEISGGMRKRAGLARAIALNPDILFFDEPSAGLDPLSAQRLDELILELRASMQCTIVVVTHDLDSIFTIADSAVFLDAEAKTMLDAGPPRTLMTESKSEKVRSFLRRGEPAPKAA